MDTKGTVNKMMFKMVSKPLAELSSNPKELQESKAKIKVYANTILFLRMSRNMILMILFIIKLRVSGCEFRVSFVLEY